MKRIILTVLVSVLPIVSGCFRAEENKTRKGGEMKYEVNKSEEEWKKQLTPEEFRILREKGTERAFTGALYDNHDKGTYVCAACGEPLFSSETKYESGSGWPSFYQPLKKESIDREEDRSYGMNRTEILCAKCGGHLGHVFTDGPKPTGLRYCINSASLKFKKED